MIRRLLPVLGFILLPLSAAAETAALVRDVNPASPDDIQGGVRSSPYPLGNKALFEAREPDSGDEVWVTDGTDAGTRLLADTCPGPCLADIRFLGTVAGVAVFRSSREALVEPPGPIEAELWRSDGTPEGTYPLDLLAVTTGNLCHGFDSAVFQGILYFNFPGDAQGCELWRTDGTVAGTKRITDLHPGPSDSYPHQLFLLKGRLHFFAFDAAGPGLWSTDGKSTSLVLRIPGGDISFHFANTGSRVFFVLSAQNLSTELWTSDGTAGGTKRLAGVAHDLQVLDGTLYFISTDVDRGAELWRSDGTVQGTRPVTSFQSPDPFQPFYVSLRIEKLGNLLVFAASDDGSTVRLWTSGGTPETTRPLSGCAGGCPEIPEGSRFYRSGSRLLFAATTTAQGTEIWSTDGTGPGTRLLGDLCKGSCSSDPAGFTAYGGAVYFFANNQEGYALWKTDGTITSRIAKLATETYRSSSLYPAAVIGGKLLMPVPDIAQDTVQLWVSDGKPDGTWMVTLIGERGIGSNPFPIATLGDQALFAACDGQEMRVWTSGGTDATTVPLAGPSVTPCLPYSSPLFPQIAGSLGYVREYVKDTDTHRLWRTDGTDAGTFLLPVEAQLIQPPVLFSGRAVFATDSEDASPSLWETDGTTAGTRKLFDLSDVNSLWGLTPVGSDFFFGAANKNGKNSLWISNGTLAGTRQLMAETGQFASSLFLLQLTRVGNLVYFRASAEGGLWRTDGTPAGTYAVPLGSGVYPSRDLIAFAGALYFTGKSNPNDKRTSLWRTDGTPGGTAKIADVGLSPELTDTFPRSAEMTVVGQHLFFAASDGVHGEEIWRTDGTPGGTVLVRDILPGSAGSAPSWLREANGKLYFNAGDAEHGRELWESDGSEAGTRMVHDIAPGESISDPRWLTRAGDLLFFSADDGVVGREPWVLPLAGPDGCIPSDRVLCLGGRFRAEIQWRDFQGKSGRGHAVSLTPDTGYFWFFDAANVEVVVKALDGQGVNGHHWVFYGALSSVEYVLTVTDTQTGAARRYVNPPGRLGSVGDSEAFGPRGATGSSLSFGPEAVEWEPIVVRSRTAAALAPCVPSSNRLCLNEGRFAVEATWRDFQGKTGTAAAVPLTGDTGYLWFFDETSVEVVLKVLDGRRVNGKFWLFYGALSSVEYTIRVTDTQTGQTKTYKNPSGRLASVADTGAF